MIGGMTFFGILASMGGGGGEEAPAAAGAFMLCVRTFTPVQNSINFSSQGRPSSNFVEDFDPHSTN